MPRAALPVFVLVTLAASAYLSAWRVRHQVPDAALAALDGSVRRSFAEGDLIVVEPPYLSYARAPLGDLPLWEPRRLGREDLAGFRRVHLISFAAIGAPASLGDVLRTLGAIKSRDAWEGVTRTTFALASHEHVAFDLRRDIAQARVTARYADGVEVACDRFDRDRWLCPRDPEWSYVGRETLDIDGQPRDCVWMHPLAGGGLLAVDLPAVNASGVLGGFGFTRDASRRAAAPVHVRLLAGDQEVFAGTHSVVPGWRHFRAPLRSPVPLRLEVTTAHNGASHFCMTLALVEPAP